MTETEKLEAERKKIWTRMKRRQAAHSKDLAQVKKLEARIFWLGWKALVGKPGAVVVYRRCAKSEQMGHLNDAPGTIVKLGREYATVNFEGVDIPWKISIHDLLPIEKKSDQSKSMAYMYEQRDAPAPTNG